MSRPVLGGDITDREFLCWLHERLVKVHGESGLVDYMHRLRAVIRNIPCVAKAPNRGEGRNSLEQLLEEIEL